MPYLPTSQAFLEQSALLLEAYPDTTRITTKYSFPSERPGEQHKRQKSLAKKNQNGTSSPDAAGANDKSDTATGTISGTGNGNGSAAAPIAVLTLKTFDPTAGICLKYRTNKGAEVGRLMTGLGKLAAGADVASLGLSGPGPVPTAGTDVEMVDAPPTPAAATEENVAAQGKSTGAGGAGGGKGKKKGGKGKR